MILQRWRHDAQRIARSSVGSLFIVCAASFGGCTEGHAMSALDSSKYFQDPKTARFVDEVQNGNAAAVQAAVSAGQDPNAKGAGGIRPIHFVFVAKSADVLEVLLKAGADPNAKAPNGNTPLHYAVQQRNPDFTRVLLQFRADPRIPGEGEKPVLYVALSSPVARVVLPLLISRGGDVNHRWGGYPPLQAAMVQQDWGSAAILMESGADPALTTQQGETAAQTFCRLLQRMRAGGPDRAYIVTVGAKLLPSLPPDCAARLAAFR